MGTIRVYLEADAPRVACRAHGPTVRQVPWARHGAGHTRGFDQQVALGSATALVDRRNFKRTGSRRLGGSNPAREAALLHPTS
jgi:transposase